MTLVVAVTGPESIWLLADRRLSYSNRPPKDDGRKIMFLNTPDGVAILGYAGLGATARRTEPADWMSAVLRGRKLPLEQSLGVLAEAIKKQLPEHMDRIPVKDRPAHSVIVPAIIEGQPRLYSIIMVLAPDRKSYRFRYTRHVANEPPAVPLKPPRFLLGGSGGLYLDQDEGWKRDLLRVLKANDRGLVSPLAVADCLATVNNDVHLALADKSVGPRCIVAWRFRKGGVQDGGGGQRFYTGLNREADSPSLPTISNGRDVEALVQVLMPHWEKASVKAMKEGEPAPELDHDEIDAELARLPDKPDENLR